MISIIIPTYNEAETLQTTLDRLHAHAQGNLEAGDFEIIIVDGGSTDGTVAIAQSQTTTVLQTSLSRAHQMNQGAAIARGDILLFLHADTHLPKNFDRLIQDSPTPAGAFRLAIDHPHWQLRLVEWGTQIRSQCFQLPYGDQAIFLSTHLFQKLNGYPELPIMEDFVLVRTISRTHRLTLLPATVTTSARRWMKRGILQTTLINQLMILGFYAGIAPETLRRWYRSGFRTQGR